MAQKKFIMVHSTFRQDFCAFFFSFEHFFHYLQLCKDTMSEKTIFRTCKKSSDCMYILRGMRLFFSRSVFIFLSLSRWRDDEKKIVYNTQYTQCAIKKGHQREWQLWRQLERRDQLKVWIFLFVYFSLHFSQAFCSSLSCQDRSWVFVCSSLFSFLSSILRFFFVPHC